MSFDYILGNRTCTVFFKSGKSLSIDKTIGNWDDIKAALDDPATTEADLEKLLSPAEAIKTATSENGEIEIVNGYLHYRGKQCHNALAMKILDVVHEGIDISRWILFAENVYSNPFEAAQDELYEFLENCNLPITTDGHFLAFKKVTADYKDIHTKTIDNSVGRVVEMPRSAVDPNRNNLCSTGLHFCSEDYLPKFGGGYGNNRVMILKINPKDVVSIPAEYDKSKGRTCRYEIVGETDESKSQHFNSTVVDDYDNRSAEDNQFDPDTVERVDVPAGYTVKSQKRKWWKRFKG